MSHQKARLSSRKSEVRARKVTDSIKRFSYLLGQTDLFKHFCDLKVRLLQRVFILGSCELIQLFALTERARSRVCQNVGGKRKNCQPGKEEAWQVSCPVTFEILSFKLVCRLHCRKDMGSTRKRKSEKDEDEEMLAAEQAHEGSEADGEHEPFVFEQSPSCTFSFFGPSQ